MSDTDLQRSALSACQSYRLGMQAQAGEAFLRFVDELSDWMRAATSVAGEPDPELVDRATRVNTLLPRVVQAQTRGDGLAVADLLEFELLPLLAAPGLGREPRS